MKANETDSRTVRKIHSSSEAATYLGVSRSSIIQLTKAGLLKTLPGFTQRMYSTTELDRYVGS
jgi:hypothetical protein